MMPECFARMDVRHVHFDDGALENGQGVANTIAVVCPCPCVDHDGVDPIGMSLVNFFSHCAFRVGLKAFHAGP